MLQEHPIANWTALARTHLLTSLPKLWTEHEPRRRPLTFIKKSSDREYFQLQWQAPSIADRRLNFVASRDQSFSCEVIEASRYLLLFSKINHPLHGILQSFSFFLITWLTWQHEKIFYFDVMNAVIGLTTSTSRSIQFWPTSALQPWDHLITTPYLIPWWFWFQSTHQHLTYLIRMINSHPHRSNKFKPLVLQHGGQVPQTYWHQHLNGFILGDIDGGLATATLIRLISIVLRCFSYLYHTTIYPYISQYVGVRSVKWSGNKHTI